MAVFISSGQVESITPPWYAAIRRESVRMYNQRNYDYATLYRLQPNVRTCVGFIARNIAQLTLNQYYRVSDRDRKKLSLDFGMTRLIKYPLPQKYKITRYRFFEAMLSDLGIYFNSYHLKIRDPETGRLTYLLRIPPIYIYPEGGLVPRSYRLEIGSLRDSIDPEDVFHVRGYNPENPIDGLSPLETLRRILAEEDAAGAYREDLWQNSARVEGFIKRPPEAPDWSPEARERFLDEFSDLYSGQGNGGKTAVLEEGMDWIPAGHSARESEYLGGRKLTREECARSYFIPLTAVGILDHATLTNVREQHKQLYQDALAPWLVMLAEDFDLQILPEFEGEVPDLEKVYSEFNLLEKLQGDFEEQVSAYQSAVGRPWLTVNEVRARQNLPALGGDADQLVTPLNVLVGGLASPRDTDPNKRQKFFKGFAVNNQDLRDRYRSKWVQVLTGYYQRQERSISSRINAKADLGGVWWDTDRWNTELKDDLLKLNLLTAQTWADLIFDQTGVKLNDPAAFHERLIPYLENHSRIQAEGINGLTEIEVTNALNDPEDPLAAVKNVFKAAIAIRAIQQAITAVTSASNFGSFEAAHASGLARKTWRVTSGNPRESHAALDGVSVGIRENFSNGMRWPGDPTGGVDEVAGCECIVEFEK